MPEPEPPLPQPSEAAPSPLRPGYVPPAPAQRPGPSDPLPGDGFSIGQVEIVFPYAPGTARLRLYEDSTQHGPFTESAVDSLVRYAAVNAGSDRVLRRDWHTEADSLRAWIGDTVAVGPYVVALSAERVAAGETERADEDAAQHLLLFRQAEAEGFYTLLAVYPEALAYSLYAGSWAEARGDTVVMWKRGGDEGSNFAEGKRLLVEGDSVRLLSRRTRYIEEFGCELNPGDPVFGTYFSVDWSWPRAATEPDRHVLSVSMERERRPLRLQLAVTTDTLRLTRAQPCTSRDWHACLRYGLDPDAPVRTVPVRQDSLLAGPSVTLRDRTPAMLTWWEDAWHLVPKSSLDLSALPSPDWRDCERFYRRPPGGEGTVPFAAGGW